MKVRQGRLTSQSKFFNTNFQVVVHPLQYKEVSPLTFKDPTGDKIMSGRLLLKGIVVRDEYFYDGP
jgi:hypothetical protein